MKVKRKQLDLLRSYLVGERPRADGEWDMYCPLHQDSRRSAQLNVNEGVWYCHAGCGGSTVTDLLRRRQDWVEPSAGRGGRVRPSPAGQPAERLSEGKVAGWAEALMSNEIAIDDMITTRGIHTATLARFQIGWDQERKAYTIPIREEDGTLVNVRRYQIRPPAGRRKIWGIKGSNAPTLYPLQILQGSPAEIIICEGELDALITNQYGFPTLTRTGAAEVWKAEWNSVFKGRKIYLCHDTDRTGQNANRKIARALLKVANEVLIIRLPYPVTEKHGKDLTDFWSEHDSSPDALRRLMDEARPFDAEIPDTAEDLDPADASVLESFDSRRVGEPMRLTVTIKGKRDPGYSIPRKVRYQCTRDAGTKCNVCPLFDSGDEDVVIGGSDPVVLELMDSSSLQRYDILRRSRSIVKCTKLKVQVDKFQAVEILYARPSVDHSSGASGGDYKNVKLTSVGRHDTLANNTVQVTGALHPNPRKQHNEFLTWDVARLETSLDRFEADAYTLKLLNRFKPRRRQRPLQKLGLIARELSSHVTRIYGRPEMHAAMDLTFHSALGFDFAGKRQQRGWLDLLVVGDTRTGKSEAATRLVDHYGAGEVVSCESASFAGVIGGLQQYGASKEWAITWGAVPINDRRLVVMDEVGGLQPEEIAQMSSVRSSGEAQLTKIQQERTLARTRLIWLGNPRNARMSDYTYGVQAIPPLIGNPEDIARFDLAMSVRTGEVLASEINRVHEAGELHYPSEACHALLRWVWSRTPEQVEWMVGAERAVFRAAQDLGSRYTEDPPLIQVANVREKIARISVALAARLYSCDESGEHIMVSGEHVEDAVALLDRIYHMPGFGYAERSRELIEDRKQASKNTRKVRLFLHNHKGLDKFLRGAGKFRRQDIEEVLNVDRELANGIISTLWEMRMVRKDKGDVRVEPTLHDILRGDSN